METSPRIGGLMSWAHDRDGCKKEAPRRRRSTGDGGLTCPQPIAFATTTRSLSRWSHLPRQRHEIAEQRRDELRHRRMDMHGALQDRVGRLGVHGVEHAVDRLVAARCPGTSRRGSASVSASTSIFMKPCGLALLEGARDVLHGDRWPTSARRPAPAHLGLGHAGAAERRIDEERIGGDAVADAALIAVEQVGGDDLVVVVRRCG